MFNYIQNISVHSQSINLKAIALYTKYNKEYPVSKWGKPIRRDPIISKLFWGIMLSNLEHWRVRNFGLKRRDIRSVKFHSQSLNVSQKRET